MANLVYKGLKANLPAERNVNSFYMTTDTRELYFGANLYTEAVRFFTSTTEVPKPVNPAQGVLYVDEKDYTGYAWDGTAWKTVFQSAEAIKAELIGTASDTKDSDTIEGAKRYADKKAEDVIGTASDTKDDDTVKGAKALANEKVASVTAAATTPGVTVDNTDPQNPKIALKLSADADNALRVLAETGKEGLFYKTPVITVQKKGTANAGFIATYQVCVDGTPVNVDIDIPKDYLVKSAQIKEVTAADKAAGGIFENDDSFNVGDKYIDFTVNTVDGTGNETHLYLNVNSLVDAYQAGNGIALDASTNTFSIKIDTANANGLEVTSAGLKLNVAQAAEGANPATAGAMSATDKEHLDAAYEAITVGSF